MLQSHQRFTVPAIIAGSTVLVALWLLVERSVLSWVRPSEPLHSSIEAIGAMVAIAMAFLLIQRELQRRDGISLLMASAFLWMGLLDGFHSLAPPGQSFVFLHVMAGVGGGVLFSLIWFPSMLQRVQGARFGAWGVGTIAVVAGIWSLAMPQHLPAMVIDGRFTPAASMLSIGSGVLFLAAAGRFLLDYHTSRNREAGLFGGLMVLNGLAGVVFDHSAIWDGNWWLWHGLRLAAYLLVLGVIIQDFRRIEAGLRAAERFRKVAESTNDWEYWIDPRGHYVYVSPACEQVTGYGVEDFTQNPHLMESILHPEDRQRVVSHHRAESGPDEGANLSFRIVHRGGEVRWIDHLCQAVYDADGRWLGRRANNRDVTELKLATERIFEQTQEIMDLSTPVLQVWEGVVTAPLIGSFDAERAGKLMEVLLARIVETRSSIAILDISSVPGVDTQTAQLLMETVTAARLLGTHVLMTGIQPSTAQTLAQLGIDLGGMETHSTLADGLRSAIEHLEAAKTRWRIRAPTSVPGGGPAPIGGTKESADAAASDQVA